MIDKLNISDMSNPVLDLDAGKKVLARMRRMSGFSKMIESTIAAYFAHHLVDHVKIDAPDIDLTSDKQPTQEAILKYANKYPDEYEHVQNVIYRQLLILVSAVHSAKANIQNEGERVALTCNAFDVYATVPMMAWIIGDMLVYSAQDMLDAVRDPFTATTVAHEMSDRCGRVVSMTNTALTTYVGLGMLQQPYK